MNTQQQPPRSVAPRPSASRRGPLKWIIALLSLALIGTAGLLAPRAFAASGVDTSSNAAFIKSIAPLAQASQKKYGVPASVAMAQAILESGWGKSSLTKKGNAFFGIKCSSKSKYANGCMNMRTREVYNGKEAYINDGFRTYPRVQNSFYDHGLFLRSNSRYSKAFKYQKNPNQFIREVHKAGYATDPNYTKLIVSIMKSNNLYKYDKPAKATKKPTKKPTKKATAKPSKKPSGKATAKPSKKGTAKPSSKASKKATATPSKKGTAKPSKKATATPSKKATAKPSKKATATPSKKTTATPSRTAAPAPTASTPAAPRTTAAPVEPVPTEEPISEEPVGEPVDAPVTVIEADPAKEGATYPGDDPAATLPSVETVSDGGSQMADSVPAARPMALPSTGS